MCEVLGAVDAFPICNVSCSKSADVVAYTLSGERHLFKFCYLRYVEITLLFRNVAYTQCAGI